MTINVQIDDVLIEEATRIAGPGEPSAIVTRIIQDFISRQQRHPIDDMLELVGKIHIRDDYDYKALRSDDHAPD